MKPLIGGVVGAVIAGVAVAGWQTRAGSDDASLPLAQRAADVRLVNAAMPSAFDAGAAGAPLSVRCEAGQRAVIRQVATSAGPSTETGCVTDAPFAPTIAPQSDVVSLAPRAVPVRYTVAEPVSSARVSPSRVAYRNAPRAQVESKRSWKKTALVIGGSAGAGAGVGAIAGGKKGALIGAAIGGGAATLYEALKR